MTFSLTIGWWLVPLLLAAALFTWAFWDRPSERGGFFPDLGPLVRGAVALIGSLVGLVVYLLVLLVTK